MNSYLFNATKLIVKVFDEREVKYQVRNMGGSEQLLVGFPVDGGTNVIMSFISTDNDNDVAARIFGFITSVPKTKRLPVLETCNALNERFRFLKFTLDSDGDVNVEYDFPVQSSNECIGEMAFEVFARTMQITSLCFEVFMKILYGERGISDTERLLEDLDDTMDSIA